MPLDLSCGEVSWGVWSVVPTLHVHFWLKQYFGTTTASKNIVQKLREAGPERNGWCLRYQVGILLFEVWTSDGEHGIAYVTPPPWGLNEWSCIDATFDGNYLRLYVDNVLVGSDQLQVGPPHELAAAATAILISAADYFPAAIEGLAIWKSVLSAGERTIFYNGGKRIAFAETEFKEPTDLEAHLELNYDDRNYSPAGSARNISVLSSLTFGGGAFTDTLGEGAGWGAPYYPLAEGVRHQDKVCASHVDLAETSGF